MSFTPSLYEPHQRLVLADLDRALHHHVHHAEPVPAHHTTSTRPIAESTRPNEHTLIGLGATTAPTSLAQPGGGPHAPTHPALDDARMKQTAPAPTSAPTHASGRLLARYAAMILSRGR